MNSKLKKMGAISHEEMLDKYIGPKGSKERDDYEKSLIIALAERDRQFNDLIIFGETSRKIN